MSSVYQKLNLDLDLGTEYLIKENAYFLGGILAADERTYFNNNEYWLAPVRHNPSYITTEELEQHFYFIKKLSSKISNETLMASTIKNNGIEVPKFRRMTGFATFFKSIEPTRIETIAEQVKLSILKSSNEIKRSFIVGLFDGRGALDINSKNNNIRNISLDCNNEYVAGILVEIIEDFGLPTNYNISRDRKEGGRPRDNQLRIPDGYEFMKQIGFISIRKFEAIKRGFNLSHYKINDDSNILKGLKSIQRKEE